MKRYFTVLALLGILGFAGVSIAEKASETKEVKEVAASICNSDSTSQNLVAGQTYTVGGVQFRAVEHDGKVVLERVE